MTISRNLSFLAEGVSSTGVLGATYGGTGQSSITTGDLLYGSASNTISKLAIGSTGTILRVVGGVPAWDTDYTGTVTSVAALTLGTTGTDLSSTVANGTTTPVITLNVPTASATNRGVLSSADWTTFNNKGSGSVTSVAASVPSFLSISGSPITTSGTLAITYSGTALPTANGGTALTSFTANGVMYATSTSALATNSSLTFDGGGFSISPTSGVWSLFIASPYSASTSAASVYNGYGTITSSNPQFFVGQRFSSQGKLSFWRYDGGHQANDLTIFNTGGVSIGNTTDPGAGNLSVNGSLKLGSGTALTTYQEGTFTPTVIGSSTAGTASYGVQIGQYTKIGNRVYINITLSYSGGTGTGNLQISGLPFNSNSTTNNYQVLSIYMGSLSLSALQIAVPLLAPNSSTILINYNTVGGGAEGNVPYDAAAFLVISGNYVV
jgi:hypothetical protein